MKTLAVHAWPGPVPAPRDGLLVLFLRTDPLRDAARLQLRQAAREALALLLGLTVDDITIESRPGTPPRILVAGEARDIGCSFAHEDRCALAAINLHGAVGVDLMRVRDIPDWQAVARDYLGPAECAALLATSAADRPRAFAEAWTRREAALKLHGQQLSEWRADMTGATRSLAIPSFDIVGHVSEKCKIL